MLRSVAIIALLAAVLMVPFALRERGERISGGDDVLVIITPHNESIRYEFSRGFEAWYRNYTGRSISLDWRVIGGTSEIVRFIRSEFTNAFRNYWERDLGRGWSQQIQDGFANRRMQLDDTSEDDTPAEVARRAFLASDTGVGLDLFFGGGSYDFIQQSRAGTLVDSGVVAANRGWFGENGIPQNFAGEPFWDPEGRWIGTVISQFGIIFNRDALAGVGIADEPRRWEDLTDTRLRDQVAVADPTKSGSMTKAFEMILQEQMQRRFRELSSMRSVPPREVEGRAIREGWARGMSIIQRIAANARYFTDSAPLPNIDVAAGDCAAGMAIDFYGRFQQERTNSRSSGNRFGYLTPIGGSTVSVDPIGMFRGAPHATAARLFIRYVLSLDGQKLWNFRVGAPGGPRKFALRRLPIRPELFGEAYREYRTDADIDPYRDSGGFVYRGAWTGPLFNELRFIIRVAFIDVNTELKAAWSSLIEAGMPADAMAVFSNLEKISFDRARNEIGEAMNAADPLERVGMARRLANHFRRQYKEAQRLAETTSS